MAPTAYQGRRNLPAATVVTQYRLDKAGMRTCLQDDITLNDGHVGRERTPTRRSVRLDKRVPGWLRPRITGRSVLVHRPAADHQLLARISRFLASGRAGRWL